MSKLCIKQYSGVKPHHHRHSSSSARENLRLISFVVALCLCGTAHKLVVEKLVAFYAVSTGAVRRHAFVAPFFLQSPPRPSVAPETPRSPTVGEPCLFQARLLKCFIIFRPNIMGDENHILGCVFFHIFPPDSSTVSIHYLTILVT